MIKECYYRAGFFEDSPVSDLGLRVIIPKYTCEYCGQYKIVNYYNYPQLDIKSVLDEEQILRLGPKIRKSANNAEILEIIVQLRRAFNVPITAGTIFGPTCLKVTSRPKVDFYALIQHAGLFCRKSAVEKLLKHGLKFEYVESPATGKWAVEAGFMELVVPVTGHQLLPPGVTFCNHCLRYISKESFPTILIQPSGAQLEIPFFKTIEDGIIVFHRSFVETVSVLGLTGLIDGNTIMPIQSIPY
jgi:hypothetical protein